MKDNGSMKSKKIMALVKGVWAFCSYVFVPQWGNKRRKAQEEFEKLLEKN